MTADHTDTGDRQGREALREAVRDVLAHWPIGSGYYSTSVGNDEALEMADAVLAALTPTDEEPREDSSGAREGHPGNAGEPADVAASRRALIDGRAAILREWAKIGSGRERWTDDMLAAAAVAALGMDGWLAAAPSVPGPAPADEDGLRDLRALSDAATPGPWRQRTFQSPLYPEAIHDPDTDPSWREATYTAHRVTAQGFDTPQRVNVAEADGLADARFIVAAVNFTRRTLDSTAGLPVVQHYWANVHPNCPPGMHPCPDLANPLDRAAAPASEPDWSYRCAACGWSTQDRRYEQHPCPAPAPAGPDTQRETLRRILEQWPVPGAETP